MTRDYEAAAEGLIAEGRFDDVAESRALLRDGDDGDGWTRVGVALAVAGRWRRWRRR